MLPILKPKAIFNFQNLLHLYIESDPMLLTQRRGKVLYINVMINSQAVSCSCSWDAAEKSWHQQKTLNNSRCWPGLIHWWIFWWKKNWIYSLKRDLLLVYCWQMVNFFSVFQKNSHCRTFFLSKRLESWFYIRDEEYIPMNWLYCWASFTMMKSKNCQRMSIVNLY